MWWGYLGARNNRNVRNGQNEHFVPAHINRNDQRKPPRSVHFDRFDLLPRSVHFDRFYYYDVSIITTFYISIVLNNSTSTSNRARPELK